MVIEKRGDKYRLRFFVDGVRKSLTIDHKPSQKEAQRLINDYLRETETFAGTSDSFEHLAKEYISAKYNVLSPNTRRGYNICLKRLSADFLGTSINDIDNLIIQREINRLASNLAPKTVKNTFGFISAVMDMYRPNLTLNIKLPMSKTYEAYCPTNEDIKLILDNCNDNYYVPFSLGILGMRRGEIVAAGIEDIDGNILHINKSSYTDENNKQGIKDTNKTETSSRSIYLPDALVERIKAQGYICNVSEGRLWAMLKELQERLGLPHFRFHDLRVYYASYAHACGIPDKFIQEAGGWKSDYTMKKVYRKAMRDEFEKAQKEYIEKLQNIF